MRLKSSIRASRPALTPPSLLSPATRWLGADALAAGPEGIPPAARNRHAAQGPEHPVPPPTPIGTSKHACSAPESSCTWGAQSSPSPDARAPRLPAAPGKASPAVLCFPNAQAASLFVHGMPLASVAAPLFGPLLNPLHARRRRGCSEGPKRMLGINGSKRAA